MTNTPKGKFVITPPSALASDLERPGHFADFKELQDVANLDVVVTLDVQAALKAFFDFARIVLETLERVEFTREDDHVFAQEANARVTANHSGGDHTTGNRADLADLEDLANLGIAGDFFFLLRCLHARHGGAQLVHSVINDVVVTNVDAVVFSQFAGLGVCTGVETNQHCFGCNGQVDV